MNNSHFPADFLWGAATASFQVEGASREDGRGQSIWDIFCRQPGAVLNGDTGDVAADQYHRYPEDVALLRRLGIQAYRFSIAWPRIIPEGRGKINQKGLDYYRKLCDELHASGIQTVATLYHWDLPQPLQDEGGWVNRSTSYAFEEYAAVCFSELGGYVDRWITLNEPYCSAYLGHYMGVHAPGHRSLDETVAVIHHLNLAHGLAMQKYRETKATEPIGITWNPTTPRPATRREEDSHAADICKMLETNLFVHPVMGKGYPEAAKTYGFDFSSLSHPGDLDIISTGPLDFIGINFYNERAVSWSQSSKFNYEFEPSWEEKTDMGWPVTPSGLLRMLRIFALECPGIPLYITENGCAMADVVGENDTVDDSRRIAYLRKHFKICREAIDEGIPLSGYFLWSFMDNFEWAFGYSKRFGIVYVDYATQRRIPKNSAYYFRDVIAGYGL
ncbi:GH1 family beta-glucosidase [Parasphaerochaeta coccoides]|uniref:Beta-glucosidase n=1 Tax=Parasphaerochaeta coccoides (strain ATCC BAA-1237 / DSM 17374 / SPN1) TaxID=760011 RepID=F4GLK2_PARC1|nr:GH1 family beta-glucosidase [Parasphaerochaeta coccoides]AEC01972.1 broad-specificity cellobiase [Parasphaerochaeta coccoides DSM 17374]